MRELVGVVFSPTESWRLSPLQTLLLVLLFTVCLHVCDVHVWICVSTCMCVGMHMCMCEYV